MDHPSRPRDSDAVVLPVYTVGHSTRTSDEFLDLLAAFGIRRVADVRAFPSSRRLPQFGREMLTAALGARGIAYRHMPALGGRRRPRADSVNDGWRESGFRGYADYMATAEFGDALNELLAYAAAEPTAIMCAEAVWWRCHRRLIADALVNTGVEVRHILSATRADRHALTPFAVIRGGRVTYPGLFQGDDAG